MTKDEASRFAVASALLPSLGVQASVNPVRFTDVPGGNEITTIACGVPYSFVVDGFTRIFLQLEKDGVQTYYDYYNVPMPPYTSICGTDPGSYIAKAFDPATGALIGQATLTITGASSAGVSPWLLIGGAAALFFLMKRRK